MSPLIDLTNGVIQEISNDSSNILPYNKCIQPLTLNKTEVKEETCNSQSISVAKDNFTNPFSIKNLKDYKKENVEIATQIKCNNNNFQHRKRKVKKKYKNKSSVQVCARVNNINDRVPPLSDEALFYALESLYLNTDETGSGTTKSNEKCNTSSNESENSSNFNLTGFINNVGPPSETFLSTFQCLACSLELSSLQNLTDHLFKHIYEGLYAASWLNTAMCTLLNPQTSVVDQTKSPCMVQTQNNSIQCETSRTEISGSNNSSSSSRNTNSNLIDSRSSITNSIKGKSFQT